MPATLDENIAAYDAMRDHLELEYFGKWVVFYDEEFVGSYDESEDAAHAAIATLWPGAFPHPAGRRAPGDTAAVCGP